MPDWRAYEIHTRGAALDNCLHSNGGGTRETECGREGKLRLNGIIAPRGPDKAEKGGSVSCERK